MFSKAFFFRVVKSLDCVAEGYIVRFVPERVENIVAVGENAGN